MNRNTKKGFTIVELIIVIAVIAVLAAVLIPTFSNLINQAQQAKDTALVSDLNKGLKMSGKEFDTMHDALTAVEENVGINVAKINAVATDSVILWDSVNQCFVYLKGGETTPTYIPDSKTTDVKGDYDYWQIVKAPRTDNKYSQYISDSNYTVDTLTVSTGFDAGLSKGITTLKYENETAHEVTIRTNGGELQVVAQNDIVHHYGEALSVDVQKVAPSSYHEYGKVGFISITDGRLAVESSAKVVTVYAAANTAKIDATGNVVENAYAADGVTNAGSLTLTTIPEGKTIEEVKEEAKAKTVAVAKVGDSYQVSLEAAFSKALTMETATIDIVSDIDMSDVSWKPIDIGTHDSGAINTVCRNLTFNGNNHTITGFNVHYTSTNHPSGEVGAGQSNYYGEGLFGRIGTGVTLVVKDIAFDKAFVDDASRTVVGTTATTSQVAVVVGINSGNTTLENIKITNSYVYGGQKVGALIGHSGGSTTIIGGEVSNTEIKCYCAQSAQAVGFLHRNAKMLSITNLKMTGNRISMHYVNDALSTNYNKHKKDTKGNTYVDFGTSSEVWFTGTATLVGFGGQGTVTLADGIQITTYGYELEYTKTGDLYSASYGV